MRRPGAWLAVGAGLWVAATGLALVGWTHYRHVDRVLPFAAGLGLVLAAGGAARIREHARALVLLGLPLILPWPSPLRADDSAMRAAAAAAEVILRIGSFPVERQGLLLVTPEATLEVFDGCAGYGAFAQVLALAVLALCLFPAGPFQRALVLLSAVPIGFAVNAGRVAFLTVVASRAPDEFAYYDGYGTGSLIFSAAASGAAGLVWWLLLRHAGEAERAPA
jgi:exosortase/archaeosortase family protein